MKLFRKRNKKVKKEYISLAKGLQDEEYLKKLEAEHKAYVEAMKEYGGGQ